MDKDRTVEELENWIDETVDANEEAGIQTDFNIDKYEHGFFIRWGSKTGDFPQIGRDGLTYEYFIIESGELPNGGPIVIADTDAKKAFDMDIMVYRYLTKTRMEGFKKGYEIVVNAPDGKYKITVERLDVEDTPTPYTR